MARPNRIAEQPTKVISVRLTDEEAEKLAYFQTNGRSASEVFRAALETVFEFRKEEDVMGMFEQAARGE